MDVRVGRGSGPSRALGVAPGYPRALVDLEDFGGRASATASMPGARLLAERLLTLPVHGALTEGDLSALGRWLSARTGNGDYGRAVAISRSSSQVVCATGEPGPMYGPRIS